MLLGIIPDTRIALIVGAVWIAFLFVAYKVWVRGKGHERAELIDETGRESVPAEAH